MRCKQCDGYGEVRHVMDQFRVTCLRCGGSRTEPPAIAREATQRATVTRAQPASNFDFGSPNWSSGAAAANAPTTRETPPLPPKRPTRAIPDIPFTDCACCNSMIAFIIDECDRMRVHDQDFANSLLGITPKFARHEHLHHRINARSAGIPHVTCKCCQAIVVFLGGTSQMLRGRGDVYKPFALDFERMAGKFVGEDHLVDYDDASPGEPQ